ncbi:N-acetylglutamate synthase, GNAT family [Gillisia sp. Hel1_33_143]|uniref:GNAT family N-acetyltransferase n=1 Tax=unclassified Gillisia TaxID=2615025 RepID=UPI000551EFEF|nr:MULTISPECIES: GNAT family N-acetyltransferase [unclassified Gillisia]SDS45092.1 N-acetylglutamate synthase, GNAT family [Gillisia sp. Hel1_33_143]
MNFTFTFNEIPNIQDIITIYDTAVLKRPTESAERIAKMYENSSLIIAAWHDEKLIGVARSLTDFSYCCYLSDLAIHPEYQKHGIGKKLIDLTKKKIGDECMLLLLSVPTAMEYYPKVGFEKVENGFIINRKK